MRWQAMDRYQARAKYSGDLSSSTGVTGLGEPNDSSYEVDGRRHKVGWVLLGICAAGWGGVFRGRMT